MYSYTIIGQVAARQPARNKAGPKDKRKVIVKQIHTVVVQAKQEQWLNLENVARLGETWQRWRVILDAWKGLSMMYYQSPKSK